MLNEGKKRYFDKLIVFALAAIFIAQLSWICYINLFETEFHLGFDASSYMLKSIEMARQRTIFIRNWDEQTSLYIDSTVPLAALLFKITGRIFLSWGISNIIMFGAIIYLYWRLISKFIFSTYAKFISLNLLSCAYFLTGYMPINDLGYSSMLYLGTSMYAFKIIVFLFIINCFIDIEKGERRVLIIVFSMILLLITGLSSGTYMLFTIIIPCAAYLIFKIFLKNDYTAIKYISIIYILLGSIVIFIGKAFSTKYLGFNARDIGLTWCGTTDFWNNLHVFLMGYPEAITAMSLTSNIGILTGNGIFMVFGLGILIITIIACVYYAIRIAKEKGQNDKDLLIAVIVLFNAFIFIFSYTLYIGQESHFQIRYLIPLMILYFMLIGIWVDNLNVRYIFSKFVIMITIICICGINYKSDKVYSSVKTNFEELDELSKLVSQYTSAPVVYFVGDNIDGRNLRVIDRSKIYKTVNEEGGMQHWGDYLYYDSPEEYPGEVIIISKNEGLQKLDTYYNNSEYLTSYNNYEIYRMKNNIMNLYCPTFKLNETYTFSGDTRSAEKAVTKGLSINEGAFSWTEGKVFQLSFYLDTDKPTISTCFDIAGILGVEQNIKIRVNESIVWSDKLDNDSNSILFDFNVPKNKIIEMEFELPDAQTPGTGDNRNLAIKLIDMKMEAD